MSQPNEPVVSNKWKPRLKAGGRRRSPSSSGSAAAAAAAMDRISALDKRRSRGEAIDIVALERAVRATSPAVGKTPAPAAPARQRQSKSVSRGWPWAVALGTLITGLAGWCAMPGGGHHSVTGTVMLGKMPLAGAELRFHQNASDTPAASVTTASDGGFRLADLPAGEYKVTVHASGPTAKGVPPAYAKPDSTLFTLHVNRDLERLRMYAVDPASRR